MNDNAALQGSDDESEDSWPYDQESDEDDDIPVDEATQLRLFVEQFYDVEDDHTDRIEKVKALVLANPYLIQLFPSYGRNCFHYVRSLKLAKFFYSQCPTAINQKDWISQQMPIHDAAANGRVSIVKFLLEKDPSMASARDRNHLTPMLLACVAGHVEVVQCFSGSVLEDKLPDGRTVMHIAAARSEHQKTLEWLLNKRPEMRLEKTQRGITPVMVANHLLGNVVSQALLNAWDTADKSIAALETIIAQNVTYEHYLLHGKTTKGGKRKYRARFEQQQRSIAALERVHEWLRQGLIK